MKEQLLPRLEKGASIKQLNLIVQTSGQTKPPARFTEATLLSAMENPTKYMETQNKAACRYVKINWWTWYSCNTCRYYREAIQFIPY